MNEIKETKSLNLCEKTMYICVCELECIAFAQMIRYIYAEFNLLIILNDSCGTLLRYREGGTGLLIAKQSGYGCEASLDGCINQKSVGKERKAYAYKVFYFY